MKQTNLIVSSMLKLTFFAPILVLTSCSTNPKSITVEVATQYDSNDLKNDSTHLIDYSSFVHEAIESAQNQYPSVFFSRNAAQVYTASFMQALMQLQLLHKNPQPNPYNDVLYLIYNQTNNYEKTIKGEKQRFNFNPILEKYGDEALKNYINEYNIKNGKILLLDSPKYIGNSSENYWLFPKSLDEIQGYLKPYLDAGVNLFDFYISDVSLIDMPNNVRDWMLAHANKLVILSDGNAQPYYFMNGNYVPWAKKQSKSYSKEELLASWNSLKTSTPNKIDFRYYYTLTDKVRIYNLSNKYIEFFNKDLQKANRSWAQLKVYNSPLNYTTLLKDFKEFSQEEFTLDYQQLNHLYKKTFQDLIVHGKEHLDKNKKNIVFIGSSLFKKDQNGNTKVVTDPRIKAEVHAYFEKIRQLYPESEYNYLYKLHPVYKDQEAIEYVKLITNNHDQNAIILDPSISWENMLTLEFQALENNESILFSKDDFIANTSKTMLFGFQPTTTVLLSTLVMLQAQFNIDLTKALLFVNPNNFPLAGSFNMINRASISNDEVGYKTNKQQLYSVYQYFIQTQAFPKVEEFPLMKDFLTSK
ncbi:hypothetical protein [Mycoplasmopsis columboralis]|uniref:Lipoprotein n=1 Tax=Mycoplasmopsis columboralis TaxID=171282 RepID=A0A449B7H5_9BACT|nr:hypothetical protein [Mycoplasmopsis columboralis]VEU76537.1 Uncharacterised protein [Mycoplasmopsis columboralis]